MDPHHPDDYSINGRQRAALIILYCGGVVSIVFTGLRVYSRRKTGSKLWWDDYLAILSGFMAWPAYITCILGFQYGMGKHVTEISLQQVEKIAYVIFFHQLSYAISYNLLFCTILALYVRIFPNRWIHKASLYLGIFVMVLCWINIILIIFQCRPISFFWDKTIPGGHCINQRLCYFINSTILMLVTLAIIFLPVPVLWQLQRPLDKKIKTILAFLVGAFIAVAAISRLVYIIRISSVDPVYSYLDAIIWSGLEISVGVTSASMASVLPLWHAVIKKKAPTPDPSDGSYPNNSKDGFLKLARSRQSSGTVDTEDGMVDKEAGVAPREL